MGIFSMCICYHVINIKMIHLILVRLQTTSGYVRHCSIKGGRGAQLLLVEQKKRKKKWRRHCLQCLTRSLKPHDLIILHRQTHANLASV